MQTQNRSGEALLFNSAAMAVHLSAVGFIMDAAGVGFSFQSCICFLIIMNHSSIARLWGWFRNWRITSAAAVGTVL